MKLAGKYSGTLVKGVSDYVPADPRYSSVELYKMASAGKYEYTPDFFPNQQLMHSLANQTNNTQLKEALLNFQYPFKLEDLKLSGYSPEIMQTVLNAVTGAA